jgi:hypothetical protein
MDHTKYRRMRSELSGLVFAGFDTTAEALAWTLGLLARNPAALTRAYEEVDALGGARLEYAHLKELPWLRASTRRSESRPLQTTFAPPSKTTRSAATSSRRAHTSSALRPAP